MAIDGLEHCKEGGAELDRAQMGLGEDVALGVDLGARN